MDVIRSVLRKARSQNRTALLETEGTALLNALGIATPRFLVFPDLKAASQKILPAFPGSKAVVKVVSAEILHKSDVGGVLIVPNDRESILAAISAMQDKFTGHYSVDGYSVCEFVPYDSSFGNEFLLGMRWTEDFGAVITFGPGGIYTEFLAKNLKQGADVAFFSAPSLATGRQTLLTAIDQLAVSSISTQSLRGQAPKIASSLLADAIERFAAVGSLMPEEISDFEINPLVIAKATDGTTARLVPLDALVKLTDKNRAELPASRPVRKIKNLLEPKSAAIIGVSEKMNVGRIILGNLIREGFDKSRISIVKPGLESLDGCRCYPDIASLPGTSDLFVLAISAAQVPDAITQIVQGKKAESIIVIPGGLEEKQGTEAIVAKMKETIRESREGAWGGPVINGGNCLGIRSVPGKYNTLFIPEYKLPIDRTRVSPVALISQSGAFAISRISKMQGISPKFCITIGNQMDLTAGDYLEYLKDDPEVEVFALYVEGFKPLDGLRVLESAREITRSGRTVIVYRAGRTAEGAEASASHTASIGGNYPVTRQLFEQAGVLVAETIDEFEDLTKTFTFLRNKKAGPKLGAVSNAGFECVAFADNLGALKLAKFSPKTTDELAAVFKSASISEIVDVHNPLDLTPMTNDANYEQAIRIMLSSPDVEVGMVGVVPLSAAITTVAKDPLHSDAHREDITRDDALCSRLERIMNDTSKAWLTVIDSGTVYDPLAARLEERGIPVFRSADRALKMLNAFCKNKDS